MLHPTALLNTLGKLIEDCGLFLQRSVPHLALLRSRGRLAQGACWSPRRERCSQSSCLGCR